MSVEETVAELTGIVESLPRQRAVEFDAALESVLGQVAPVLRTSRHEQRVLAQIQQARDDGTTAITTALDQITETVQQVCARW